MEQKLLTIENKSGKVRLNDVVCKPVIDELITQIGKLFGASAAANGVDFGTLTACAENAVDTLDIEINSPGGSIFDGYDIYNEIMSLRERGVVVTATITGMAASMASVICMACDVVRMVPHGRMMIHEASNGVRGNAQELRKAADLLDSISADIANIYAKRTGMSADSIREMMKAETWMNAEECIAKGFANEIFDIRAKDGKPTGMSLLSKLFPGNDEAAKIEAAITENDSLRAELTEAQAKISELSGLSAIIAEKDQEITAMAAKISELEASTETFVEEMKAKDAELAEAKESASKIATETLASIGQSEPINLGDASAPVDHIEAMKSMTPGQKRNYWKTHKAEIHAQLNQR